ncbi:MAG: alpha-amylase family glycosyl hydrolase [Deferrisomatales bacterium]|nr:alpha-amylase family glycosyl hydrolase [Deferrisomatales bacterium]
MDVQRKRTFYDPFPDYGRPRLRLPADRRERLLRRLAFLYGEARAKEWLPELERILTVHVAHKPPEMHEKERGYDPAERFHQEHEVLITYGDLVKGQGETPLSVLHDFVVALYPEAINTLHLLPFFPYSSDRGFAVVDFRRVDPQLGSWEDIRRKKACYDLMFDAVLNHCSSQSEMFLEFRNDHPDYREFFIAFDSPDDLTPDQRRKIFRPRTSDILTRFDTLSGPKWLWTTFSADQIDLNFRNPAVLMQVIDSLLFYIRGGADLLRLDAVTYLWAEPGTESVHLPQTHEIVKLVRDVVDAVALGVALVTETNVPFDDNVSYFGDGSDEAHMVYQFTLPPLVLHAFYREDATLLTRWAAQVHPPSDRATFFNVLDTHDGIGLVGAKGFLPPGELGFVIETARARGAYVSYKRTGELEEEPYEINSTWWSALDPGAGEEPLKTKVRRYLATRAVPLVLQGVPGIYVHGALGSPNDHEAVRRSGVKRDVNRGFVDADRVRADLQDPHSKLSLLHRWGGRMARTRAGLRVFHPNGRQRVLSLAPQVFAVCRSSPEGDEHLLALINVTGGPVALAVPREKLPERAAAWRELLSGTHLTADAEALRVPLEPYQVAWLVPAA